MFSVSRQNCPEEKERNRRKEGLEKVGSRENIPVEKNARFVERGNGNVDMTEIQSRRAAEYAGDGETKSQEKPKVC